MEGRWATSETAFETFLSEMKTRKKSAGNTWGVIADEDAFRKAWLEKRAAGPALRRGDLRPLPRLLQ